MLIITRQLALITYQKREYLNFIKKQYDDSIFVRDIYWELFYGYVPSQNLKIISKQGWEFYSKDKVDEFLLLKNVITGSLKKLIEQ